MTIAQHKVPVTIINVHDSDYHKKIYLMLKSSLSFGIIPKDREDFSIRYFFLYSQEELGAQFLFSFNFKEFTIKNKMYIL